VIASFSRICSVRRVTVRLRASRTIAGPQRPVIRVGILVAVTVIGASCGKTKPTSATTSSASATTTAPAAGTSGDPGQPTPLSAPKTSPAQDAQYLADVAEADSALASYVQTQGNVALRALLTDGSAFCAFLQRGGGIDNAMASVVIGARTVESQTHLPSTVTTFNTIDAVALLTLCPSEQTLLPPDDQARIRQLGSTFATQSS